MMGESAMIDQGWAHPMIEAAETEGKQPARADMPRLVFWIALAIAAMGAGIAVAAGDSAGQAGAILVISVLAAATVFFIWLSRGAGRLVGLFPERGAAETASTLEDRAEFAWLEALEEPTLVADKSGCPIAANAAYSALAVGCGVLGESDRPPHLDRLFAADPLVSPAMFRLARAAAQRQARREVFPASPVSDGAEGARKRVEVSVGPLGAGRVVWRILTPTAVDGDVESVRNLFMDEAPIGFCALDADGVIVFANRALHEGLKAAPESLIGLKLRDLGADDAIARLLRRESGAGPATLRAMDGTERPASLRFSRAVLQSDDLTRVYLDLGRQERAASADVGARAVAGSGALGDAFFASAPFGAAVLDGIDPATATILDANAALMDMAHGAAASGAIFADLFEASDGPAALAKRLRQASRAATELQLAGDNAVAAHVQVANAGDGKSFAYVVNVSEQRDLQQRLAQAEKMREIGLLAGGVAHDFNNLLTVVMLNCDYLLRRHPVGDPDFQDLSEINNHALRAKELSEMLRAYARQQTFKREVVEPTAFFAGVQELIRRLVGETITFELRHGRDLPFVKVDKGQLERVMVNLASNARDAMTGQDSPLSKDRRLTIRTGRATGQEARALGHTPIEDGDYLVIEVIDTGCGIKADDQARIFRPFHSTKEAGKGTGLGLATSYGIVKQHEGYIFFDSRLGLGTTFRVYLRAYEQTVEEAAEKARIDEDAKVRRVQDVAGRGRILLVEDEFGVRKAIARNLAECGYEVEQAEDGEEGLDKLRATSTPYDLIISDVSMPIMKGPEMLEAAGPELIGDTPVLFLSGFAPEEFAQVLERYPVSYMAKPVGFADLAKRVKELMAA
jgi:two-component system, cell cycle sensor histidine kinase and response regulator CckA